MRFSQMKKFKKNKKDLIIDLGVDGGFTCEKCLINSIEICKKCTESYDNENDFLQVILHRLFENKGIQIYNKYSKLFNIPNSNEELLNYFLSEYYNPNLEKPYIDILKSILKLPIDLNYIDSMGTFIMKASMKLNIWKYY